MIRYALNWIRDAHLDWDAMFLLREKAASWDKNSSSFWQNATTVSYVAIMFLASYYLYLLFYACGDIIQGDLPPGYNPIQLVYSQEFSKMLATDHLRALMLSVVLPAPRVILCVLTWGRLGFALSNRKEETSPFNEQT